MAAVASPVIPVSQSTSAPTTVSVIICAYTNERWRDILSGVDSLARQTHPPDQIVLVVDHNDNLLQKAADHFAGEAGPVAGAAPAPAVHVLVVANHLARGLSGARNSGVSWCDHEVVAFLDDDAAVGDPYWIATMLEDYQDSDVAGVGGGATPNWEGSEPPEWFPDEFGWVIGCSYTGLPTEVEQVRNFIGCNMSFRREVFNEIGGFTDGIGRVGKKPVSCVETEYCVRLRHRWPLARLVFDPDLDVRHRVSPDRREFRYFRNRCWSEGLSKAVVARNMGAGNGLASERTTTTTTVVTLGVLRGIGDGLRGRWVGFQRAGAIVLGLAWTTAGYIRGRLARTTR